MRSDSAQFFARRAAARAAIRASTSASLIAGGRLQSIDTLEVVLFLEEKYGIDFAENGFDQNQVGSIDNILALIGRR